MNAYAIPGIVKYEKDLKKCLKEAGISISELSDKTRKREIAECRQAVMAFAITDFGYTQEKAARIFMLNHATANHSRNKIHEEMYLRSKHPNMQISKGLELYLKLVEIKNNKTL